MNKNIIFVSLFIIIIIGAFLAIHQKKSVVVQPNTYPTNQPAVNNATSTASTTPISHPATSTTSILPIIPKVQSYTLADINLHNNQTSCWTTIQGKVYDLTNFISIHRGGEENILKICGIDGTALFEGQHGGQGRPEQTLAPMFIGNLK